jgi:PhnB protein
MSSAATEAAGSHPTSRERIMQTSLYLFFDGHCEEAVKFYAELLGGEVENLMRYEGSPAAAHVPPDWRQKIMHGRLTLGDTVIMVSDAPPQRHHTPQGFSVTLGFDNPAEAERVFKALAQGGQVGMAMEKTFFAERFGMATDRFGTPWMVLCEKPA